MRLLKMETKMDKGEIIDAYIKYIKSLRSLDDGTLTYIICKAIEKDPEQLDIFERLLFKKEKIKLSTLTFAQSTKPKDSDFDFKEIGTEINIYVENGCLSTDELKKLTQCIREIEQNNTERLIKIWMDTPEKTVKEMEDVINSVNPEFPHKMVLKGPRISENDDWTKF
jgi:hypothetical protein